MQERLTKILHLVKDDVCLFSVCTYFILLRSQVSQVCFTLSEHILGWCRHMCAYMHAARILSQYMKESELSDNTDYKLCAGSLRFFFFYWTNSLFLHSPFLMSEL